MADGNRTEVIVLDLRTDAMRARRDESRALRALRHATYLKALLGVALLFAGLVTLLALLRG